MIAVVVAKPSRILWYYCAENLTVAGRVDMFWCNVVDGVEDGLFVVE